MAGTSEAPALRRALGRVGPHRDRRQPGDRQRDLPAAGRRGAAGRAVGPAGVHGGRVAVAVDRAVLCRGRQPVRKDRRPVPAGARRLRPLRRLRGGLDDVVHARHQPGVGRQRPGAGAGVLLAGARRPACRGRADRRADARADVDQRARHQAVVVGGERADDRQARCRSPSSSSPASGTSIRRGLPACPPCQPAAVVERAASC